MESTEDYCRQAGRTSLVAIQNPKTVGSKKYIQDF